ncbi:MAG: flagellar hook-associated protein FlgK [Lachnospiraceae bacterium]|nr:flagellar hook-associated protein FlgK [Lachnospiraceae bacterium]
MASQFFGLNIAYTGLQASNAWLTTTANNIANVETEGYSRQEVKQEAAGALRVYASYGMAGSGVDAKGIEQIRNQFYDLKYWNSNATLGSFEMKEDYVKQIEDYFTETDMVEGFGSIYNKVFSGLDEVYKSAGSSSTKIQFLYLAGNLGEYFASMSNNLRKLQEDANLEIKNQVDTINTLGAEIASMNKQINAIEINGIIANELRDKRSVLIDKLSKIVDVDVKETPIYTEEGGTIESGANRYVVRIAGGQELVNCYEYNTLECVAREHRVNQSDADGLYDIMWSNNLEFNLYGRNLNGILKGLVEVRDGNNEEFFRGDVIKDSTDIQDIKLTIKLDPSEADVMKGETLNSVTIGGTEYAVSDWDYDTKAREYTIVIDKAALPHVGHNDQAITVNYGSGQTYTKQDDDPNDENVKVNIEVNSSTIRVSVDKYEYLQDMLKSTLNNKGEININNREFEYSGWSYDDSTKEYTFTVFGDPGSYDDKDGQPASIGNSVQYQGIPYYQEQMNEWVRQFARAMNDVETQAVDKYGQHAEVLFAADNNTDDKMWMFGDIQKNPDGTDKKDFSSTNDTYYQLTASNFIVNKNMMNDVNKFLTNKDPYQGQDQQDILEEMMTIQTDKDKMSFRGCSSKEFLECVLSDVALNSSNARTFAKNYDNISKSINNQRLSVSGVDNDEEALNLVKFQEAYNLSAKMIQVFTEIYDRLILNTGV